MGAGAEWMFAHNWSVGVEYVYVDLGSSTITLAPAGGFFFNTSVKFDDREHVARVKINYHFGGPGRREVLSFSLRLKKPRDRPWLFYFYGGKPG